MIKVKCLIKKQLLFFSNMLARKIAPKIFSLFQTFFLLKGNKKNWGGRFFSEKTFHPNFFICFYFIGAGGDENLNIYLVWPNV